jgi:hypothetical protein
MAKWLEQLRCHAQKPLSDPLTKLTEVGSVSFVSAFEEGSPEIKAADIVWTHELLDVFRAGACPCCGQIKWWRDGRGVRKCAICHPSPQKK